MTSFGKFTLRFAIYGAITLYLAGDLVFFHGPLYRRIAAARPDSPGTVADARARGVAARVFGREITLAQIDHAVLARLATDWRDPAPPTPEVLRMYRYAALGELIDHEILRVKVMHSASELPVDDAEVDAEFARIAARFADEGAFRQALADAGSEEGAFRERLAARVQQVMFVETRVAALVAESAAEADVPSGIDPADGPEAASAIDALKRRDAVAGIREAAREFEIRRARVHIDHEVLRGGG